MLPQGIPYTSLAELKAIPNLKLFGFETSKVALEKLENLSLLKLRVNLKK